MLVVLDVGGPRRKPEMVKVNNVDFGIGEPDVVMLIRESEDNPVITVNPSTLLPTKTLGAVEVTKNNRGYMTLMIEPCARDTVGTKDNVTGTKSLPETRSAVAILNDTEVTALKVFSFHIAIGFKGPVTAAGLLMSDKLPMPP